MGDLSGSSVGWNAYRRINPNVLLLHVLISISAGNSQIKYQGGATQINNGSHHSLTFFQNTIHELERVQYKADLLKLFPARYFTNYYRSLR